MGRDPKNRADSTRTARNAAKPEQRANRRAHRHTGVVADWGTADPDKLHRAVTNVTKHGFAILLGYTRDGGSLTVRVYGDGESTPEYIRGSEDVDLYLTGLAEDYMV